MRKINTLAKRTGVMAMVFSLAIGCTVPAFADWKQDAKGTWWEDAAGKFPKGVWAWIDEDGDGVYKCYAFDAEGYRVGATVIDGKYTAEDGSLLSAAGTAETKTFPTGVVDAEVAITSLVAAAASNVANAATGIANLANAAAGAANSVAAAAGVQTGKSITKTSTKLMITNGSVNSANLVANKYITKAAVIDGVASEPDTTKTSKSSVGPAASTIQHNDAPIAAPAQKGPDGLIDDGSGTDE